MMQVMKFAWKNADGSEGATGVLVGETLEEIQRMWKRWFRDRYMMPSAFPGEDDSEVALQDMLLGGLYGEVRFEPVNLDHAGMLWDTWAVTPVTP